MNYKRVKELLESNKNDRGILHWNKMSDTNGLKSFGIGLTQLRKLAKKVGRNHELALELWQSNYYDIKVIALLIDEPKRITKQQAESQVEELNAGMLRHVFSSCDATLSKASFALELSQEWLTHLDPTRRSCGYGLMYEFSKNNRNKAFSDELFLDVLKKIDDAIAQETNSVRMAMGGALIGIGKRNQALNKEAIKIAKRVGKIEYNDGDRKCDPIDVMKHLTSEYLKEKFSR